MGYVPNAVAQSLQGRRTNTIGVVVPSISDPYLANLVNGIEQIAQPAGFSVLLSATHNDPELEAHCLDVFRQRRVDGILLASTRGMPPPSVLKSGPFVLVNNQSDLPRAMMHSVSVDDRAGSEVAARHLLSLGHRAIGYVGAASRAVSNKNRLQGFRDAMDGAGVVIDESAIIVDPEMRAEPDEDVAIGNRALSKLLERRVTAIVCYNDMIALGVLLACRDLHIDVPGQLSVIGFDNVPVASYTEPGLTTVHQPAREIGMIAMQTLQNLIDDKPSRNTVVTPRLIERGSTAAPAKLTAKPAKRRG